MSSRMRGCDQVFQRATKGTTVKTACNSRHLCPSCKRILHKAEGMALGASQGLDEKPPAHPCSAKPQQATSSSTLNDIIQKLIPPCIADRDRRIQRLEQELKNRGPTQPGQISSLPGHDYSILQEETCVPANTPGNWQHPYGCYLAPDALVWYQKSPRCIRQLIKEHNALYQNCRPKKPKMAPAPEVNSSRPIEIPETFTKATTEEVLALKKETEERIKQIQSDIFKLKVYEDRRDDLARRRRERVGAMEARIGAIRTEGFGLGIGLEPNKQDVVEPTAIGDPRRRVDEEIIRFERRTSSMGARLDQLLDECYGDITLGKVCENHSQQSPGMAKRNGTSRRRSKRRNNPQVPSQNSPQSPS